MTTIKQALGLQPGLDAEILLAHVLQKNRAYLYAHPDLLLSTEQLDKYKNHLMQRLEGTPIAYITQKREFWSLNLKVNEHTLIPRHETELLVELALEKIPPESSIHILELGTGSGAIAVALAHERPQWTIDAVDISRDALMVAQENAARYQLKNIKFYYSDWYKNILRPQYHAIISNPPYIAFEDPHVHQGDLRFEPQHALVSNENGLADLRIIIQQGYNHLHPGGLILLEHGFNQKLNVRAILNELQFKNIQCWQDIQGHDRVSGGWRMKS
ncbi:MAG: peptide chain release factor N(5)-glutamine methyltransferase [Legionella sp.]|nr:peptide chain release factor N(5)-glutamine methyltransferase [Legionella sp.]